MDKERAAKKTMEQLWSPDTIRFLRDAAAVSGYYAEIARRAAAYFPPDAHVCDAGCGLGELSLALLPYCRRVTAIDLCPAPIADLAGRLTPAQRARLEPVCGDILSGPPAEQYDAMVFCLFGTMEEILRAAARCRGTVVAVKRDRAVHRFTAGGRDIAGYSGEAAEALLRRLGIPCRTERFTLELGQPLRSLEDAERFFRAYDSESAFSREEILGKLEKGKSPEFPYYLPNQKYLRLLAFPAGSIPERRECRV